MARSSLRLGARSAPRLGCAIRKSTSVPNRDSIAHRRRFRFLGSAGCAAAGLAIVAALSACDGDVGEVREWTPGDHDHAANQAPQVSARSPEGHAPGVDMSLIDLAWRRNCEKCHGPRGRGDGPEGAMVRAPDLTRIDWQDKVSDQEILDVIRKGKNKMPGFEAALPQPVLDGLVKRIRAARASGPGGERAAPPGSRGER